VRYGSAAAACGFTGIMLCHHQLSKRNAGFLSGYAWFFYAPGLPGPANHFFYRRTSHKQLHTSDGLSPLSRKESALRAAEIASTAIKKQEDQSGHPPLRQKQSFGAQGGNRLVVLASSLPNTTLKRAKNLVALAPCCISATQGSTRTSSYLLSWPAMHIRPRT
jgi:hypothetical protein